MTTEQPETVWAVVELLGHVKLAGRLSEEEKFGAKMGRLDIPASDGFTTQFFGGASVYRITPVTEAVARQVAGRNQPAPVSPWDYPKQLAGHAAATQQPYSDSEITGEADDFGDEDEIDEYDVTGAGDQP